MKELTDLIVYFKHHPTPQNQPAELEILTLPANSETTRSAEYQQGFAAGLKAARDMQRAENKHLHRIMVGLKREVKSFEEKLDVVDRKFGLLGGSAVEGKLKGGVAGKGCRKKDHDGEMRAVEREFGA